MTTSSEAGFCRLSSAINSWPRPLQKIACSEPTVRSSKGRITIVSLVDANAPIEDFRGKAKSTPKHIEQRNRTTRKDAAGHLDVALDSLLARAVEHAAQLSGSLSSIFDLQFACAS